MEIKISKSSKECAACERGFVHEQEMTSIVTVENQVLVRRDYCMDCWNEERSKGAFSVWSPKYYDPAMAEQEPPEVFSPLRQVFHDSVEANEREELAVAYLAAQMLRRQRVFRLIKESEDPETESHVILFADRIANRLIEVRDPNLTYAELEKGRVTLLERLSKLENPEPDTESAEHAETEQVQSA